MIKSLLHISILTCCFQAAIMNGCNSQAATATYTPAGVLVHKGATGDAIKPVLVDTPAVTSLNGIAHTKRNCVKITPLRFLISHPGIELSYERYLGKRFSAQVSWARLYNITWEHPSGEGYQLSLEGKYFDIEREPGTAPYIAIESGYFDISIPDGVNSTGNKRIQYLIPKLGVQVNISSRLILDAYFGLGIKHQMGTAYNTFNILREPDSDFWDLRIASNIKIGWRF